MKYILFLLCILLFAACSPSPEELAVQTASASTSTAAVWTKTPLPTQTDTPAPTTTPTRTPTPTRKPTRTPVPPTPTEAPVFVQSVNGGEPINVAAPMLALVLPLPGEFLGEVRKNNAIIGISLRIGQDRTEDITTDSSSLIQEPNDIVMTWGEESFFFGVAEFENAIEVPIFLDASTGNAIIGWKEAFLSLVKNGRRLLLNGTLRMPVVDPVSKKILYVLEYQFEENASILWNQDSRRFVWSNMKITNLPATDAP